MSGKIRFIRLDGSLAGETDFLEPQLNLLAHAQAIELEIGSLCGGHGVCGGDWVRVPETGERRLFSPITESERGHLSEADLAGGFRLACQVYPERSGETVEVYLPE